jgi:hypothetical protein
MTRPRQLVRCLTLVVSALVGFGCSLPSRNDLEVMQSVNDLGDAVSALRQDYGVLADQVDSLRSAIAKQDSLLRRLANLAGVAVPSAP